MAFMKGFRISNGMEWGWGAAAVLLTVARARGGGEGPGGDNWGEGQNGLPVAAVMIMVTKFMELAWSYYVRLVDLRGKSVQGRIEALEGELGEERGRWERRKGEYEERISFIYGVAKKREADYEEREAYLYKEREVGKGGIQREGTWAYKRARYGG